MADGKISAFTAASDLNSSTVPILQGGANKKAAIALFDARYQPMAKSATSATTGAMTTTMTGLSEFTITPTGDCTFNASGGASGQSLTFIITTSGTSSFTLTFGTNFKSTGTLATGTSSGKVFTVSFRYDGTNWCETARSTAM